MLFISVSRTGKILLEFMFNFDSQNLSGYRDTAGNHKTQAIVEVFFIEGFRSLVTV